MRQVLRFEKTEGNFDVYYDIVSEEEVRKDNRLVDAGKCDICRKRGDVYASLVANSKKFGNPGTKEFVFAYERHRNDQVDEFNKAFDPGFMSHIKDCPECKAVMADAYLDFDKKLHYHICVACGIRLPEGVNAGYRTKLEDSSLRYKDKIAPLANDTLVD